jgi:DNA-binding CsgD family transcriptional regulator/PAS domain-containing protein
LPKWVRIRRLNRGIGGDLAAHRTTRDAILAAIDGLYAAASGDLGWDAALARLAESFKFPAAAVQLFDPDFNLIKFVAHELDDSVLAEYSAHYRALDPLFNMIMNRSKPIPDILYTYQHTPEDQIDRSEYYAWKDRRINLVHHLGMCTKPGKPYLGFMTMQRSRSAGHAEAGDIALFSRLAPHLERALAVEYSIGSAAFRAAGAEELLDCVPNGIVMLDGRATVVYANRMARAMAEAGDSFILALDGIKALRPADDAVLKRLIGTALGPTDDVYAARGGTLRLPRHSGKRDYDVLIAPIAARGGLFERMAPTVCLTIIDLAMAEQPHLIFRQLYRATPAEIRVAERLAAGDAPKRIAESLAISVATVREHLRALYRKTGTSRQSELIRLLVLLPRQHGAPTRPSQSEHG